MTIEQEHSNGASESAPQAERAVFLSHSSEDGELALRLCALLEKQGLFCWISPRDIPLGQPWPLECLRGVAESNSFVLLASEKSLTSREVLAEVAQAHKRDKPIYTVLIPPAKVKGEMDYYLSRLHWMESAGKSPDEIATKLITVLGRKRDWKEIATPPTLRRTMRYRPVAFAKLAAAATMALVIVLGGAAYLLDRMLDLDFRRLGYVDLQAEQVGEGHQIIGHAQVWLMAKGVRFQDVRLTTAVEAAHGESHENGYSTWEAPEQVGSMQEMKLPLGLEVRRVATCLVLPSPGLHAPYRVTQRFALVPGSDGIRVVETAEKQVTKEKGAPCGARP